MYRAYKQLNDKMYEQYLIQQEPVLVKKTALEGFGLLAGLDRGCTLTKVLYATEADAEHYQLNFALFVNKHFEEALQHLKQQKLITAPAAPDTNCKLKITGTGGSTYAEKIKSELGYDVEFIDEAVSQFAGFHYLVKNFEDSEICHASLETQSLNIERSELFKRLLDEQAEKLKEEEEGEGEQKSKESRFPCLFCIYGSSAGIGLVHEDGSIEVKHRHLLGGKSFLGCCQLLLGTCNYADVMRLAAGGYRGNVDSQVRDLLADAPNGPYGRMPPSMAVFPFGKAADAGRSLENSKPEDIAQSLVSCFVANFYHAVSCVARKEKVKFVYFGGNFCQHPLVQKEVMEQVEFHGGKDMLQVRFLKTGHTGALGSMISSEEDVKHFFSTMQVRTK